jgi:branched-chain amino acid transport system permease protein
MSGATYSTLSDLASYLITGLGTGCGYALIGSGLVAVYRVTRVVNFAQGAFAVVGAMCASSFLTVLPHGIGELGAVAVAAVVGLLVGLVATSTTPQAALIVTLGLAVFAYAVEVLVWGDQPRSFEGLPGAVSIMDGRVQSHYLLVIGVTLPVFAGMAMFFTRTDTGKALTACASNPYAARVIGLNVRRMGLLAFTIGGALGGLAGVLVTPVQQITFDSDVTLIVNGFAAAILAGLTRPVVTLAGGLLLGVAQSLVAGYGSAAHQTDIALGLMLAVMIWRAARRPAAQEELA